MKLYRKLTNIHGLWKIFILTGLCHNLSLSQKY